MIDLINIYNNNNNNNNTKMNDNILDSSLDVKDNYSTTNSMVNILKDKKYVKLK